MSSENTKKPFKLVEIPVNNFKDVAVPHHLKLLAEHKETVEKEFDDINKMRTECVSMKRTIAQLKGLLYELDTLRAQVENSDLDKFDQKTVSLRKTILQMISEYTELLKRTNTLLTPSPRKQNEGYTDESPEPKQLQISVNIDELKIRDKEASLQRVESLQTDIQDLHSAYGTLHSMVVQQGDDVNTVETNVDSADMNVQAGVRHIITASRLKKSIYPVTGAIVGACVAGPVGLIAGLKVGGLAGLCCGILGFFGGNVIKNEGIGGSTAAIMPPNQEEESINNDNSRSKKDE